MFLGVNCNMQHDANAGHVNSTVDVGGNMEEGSDVSMLGDDGHYGERSFHNTFYKY